MGLPAYRDATLAAKGDQMTKVRGFLRELRKQIPHLMKVLN